MTLIKSISGIRGTIGGTPGNNLTPFEIVKFAAAYAQWLKSDTGKEHPIIILGRDARISGEMVSRIVSGTLSGMGVSVVDAGLATTPTVEMAVIAEKADGGIILTASHNPKQWNALKLLNNKGEFLSADAGAKILQNADSEKFNFVEVGHIGNISQEKDFTEMHIQKILDLELVDVEAIKNAGFTIAVDAVNSVGGAAIPKLLEALGVVAVVKLNCEPTGIFAHNPEPLPEHLTEISAVVSEKKAHAGFVVDPDVDRLAIICEDGSMFGEEYTIVAVADYILSNKAGNTVSNLSSSRALNDITLNYGKKYEAAAVGEVNVVAKMKESNAVFGGEGNGGVIYPELHYGRDALVGIALFLTYLAKSGKKVSELKVTYPQYVIVKNKIHLTPHIDVDAILEKVKQAYSNEKINDIDGVKIDFENGWVHLRKSNTEPIIRVYAEHRSEIEAKALAKSVMEKIQNLLN
jgi:phosphomannomutase